MEIVIYHNPGCSKSRAVLQIIRDAGYAPEVVQYLKVGWTQAQLEGLFEAAGLTPRDALRTRGGLADQLGLLETGVDDARILAAMVDHPSLVERPIVASQAGVRLCRPPASVLELLDTWPAGPYATPDGKEIIDAKGNRVA